MGTERIAPGVISGILILQLDVLSDVYGGAMRTCLQDSTWYVKNLESVFTLFTYMCHLITFTDTLSCL